MNLSTYKIDERGCWIWAGKTCSGGRYGRISGSGVKSIVMAHRASYETNKGPIPEGLFVCHTCDNGLCINPEHLFVGTNSDNQKDAFKKGRSGLNQITQKGEMNNHAKLTLEIVEGIRTYHQRTQCSYKKLADAFGLKSKGHAYNIVKRLCW